MLALSVGTSTKVFATNDKISEYEKKLNSINKEFNLNLGYVPVDESKVSLEEYERVVRQVAKQQRELLDYIAMREKQSKGGIENGLAVQSNSSKLLAITSKTVTKDVQGLETYFKIKVTYDVNGSKVGNLRNAELQYKWFSYLSGTYVTNIQGPTYSIIDMGRTGTVKFVGTIHYNNRVIGLDNTVFYAEFTATSK